MRVLILVCVEVSVGELTSEQVIKIDAEVLILVCVEVSVGDFILVHECKFIQGLNPCLCGS